MNTKQHTAPPNSSLDFHDQKLAGRSFRKQDLAGADFSGCDLRGVDFREADLTGAYFRGARMGRPKIYWLVEFAIGIIAGIVIAMATIFGLVLLGVTSIQSVTHMASVNWSKEEMTVSAFPIWLLIQLAFAYFTRTKRFEHLFWFIGLVLILTVALPLSVALKNEYQAGSSFPAMAGLSVLGGAGMFIAGGIGALACLIAGVGALGLASVGSGGITGTIFVTTILTGVWIWFGSAAIANDVTGARGAALAEIISVVTVLGISWWFSRDALREEAPELDWLRKLALSLRSLGGSDFRDAILNNANFSQANLLDARFARVELSNTIWYNAINLHLANTYETVLQYKPVRNLLITGEGNKTALIKLDLNGMDFSNMKLAEVDFTDADLSKANFSNATLTSANLTRAMLLGADLHGARLTGAIIAHWNINKHTRFDDVDCDYVYLDEEGKVQQPTIGNFQPGEFAKLYQEIAETIDFLIEKSSQMEALLHSLQMVRAKYGEEVRVRKVEEKEGALKVSVAAPPEQLNAIRQELTHEFAVQRMALENRVQLLELEKHHLQREAAYKGNILEKLLEAKLAPTIITQAETIIMADNHSITGSIFNQSAIAQGTDASAHNTVQGNAALVELEILLARLTEQIHVANLPEKIRETALAKVETLREAATQPQTQGRLIAAKALGALEAMDKLANVADLTLKTLGALFGL